PRPERASLINEIPTPGARPASQADPRRAPLWLCVSVAHYFQPVTAPVDADDTSFAYFASTPVTYRGAGAFHVFARSRISSSLMPTSRRRFLTSMTIGSPSR